MKLSLSLLFIVLILPCLVWAAELPPQPTDVTALLQKLKSECDNPRISNESEWPTMRSVTERKRLEAIIALKAVGPTAEVQVRQELAKSRGEYKQMLIVALAAFGDNTSIWEAGRLMIAARPIAVRVCAANILRSLKDKRLIEPFKQALADPFSRMDRGCVNQGLIYPVRLIASDALFDLGLTLEAVREIEDAQSLSRLRADLQSESEAQSLWKKFLSDFDKGKPLSDYVGKEVSFKGGRFSSENPMEVKADGTDIFCLVFLKKDEVEKVAHAIAEDCTVEIKGVIHSIDSRKKRVEVFSQESKIIAAD